jgi:hypothetical protein
MKSILLITLLTGLSFNLAQAQPGPEARQERREERIQAFRVAIYTDILNLTAEEAQSFWPVYNELQDRLDQLQEQYKPARPLDSMNDGEVEDLLKRRFELRQRELDLEKEYYLKMRKVLPLRKIARIPQAEREFREALVQKLKENREKNQQRRGQR